MDGKVGVLVVVTSVLLHRLCHSNVPELNLQKKERNKDGAMLAVRFPVSRHTFSPVTMSTVQVGRG